MIKKRENFGSRLAVIMAMAGSAIGLGNIWRFPYLVGEHGGSTFIILYIIATIIVSLPVFVAEMVIGRRSRCNAASAFDHLSGGKRFWKVISFLPIAIPLIIVSYYSVIGGWSLEFFFKSLDLSIINAGPSGAETMFEDFLAVRTRPIVLHLVFMALTALIVAGGVKAGIEKFSLFTMPVLFLLIIVIAVYSVTLPGASAGVEYLVKPDFSEFTPKTLAYAMGQSFYSLSLGMGTIITYGSYVKKSENLLASGVGTAVSDLTFALLAGFAIMPAVFAAGIAPGAGPGLIFKSVPYIFATMAENLPVLSTVISAVFFLTVIVAALTSSISLLEVGVAFISERTRLGRKMACLLLFVLCGGAGVLCSLSDGTFNLFDRVSSNFLLFLMALLTVIFVGFVMKKDDVQDEVTNGGSLKISNRVFPALYFLIKWVAPVAVVLIFVTNFIL